MGKMIPNAEIYDVGSAKHKVQLERHTAVTRAIERFIDDEDRGSWRGDSKQDDLLAERIWLHSYSPDTPPTLPYSQTAVNRLPG
ncbi:MAG: hypothetical protein M5U34_42560 [Chloroflexi bacterium]|nr:hypothetical protein [Chloroflexota bacterium]